MTDKGFYGVLDAVYVTLAAFDAFVAAGGHASPDLGWDSALN